mgnify:CR=1 FL=1
MSQVSRITPSVITVSLLFAAFLILSNLTAFKLVQYAHLIFPAGLVFFPITYIFDDILTEVYGFKVSRRIIWSALLANIVVMLGTCATVYLSPSPFWHDQQAYATVYQAVPRTFLASIVGYLSGEFVNSMLLAQLKVRFSGRYLWLRFIVSTAIGVGIDTILFSHVAFWGLIPYRVIWSIIGTMYGLKLAYEIVVTPITYKVSNALKRKDNIDHYDTNTAFNPFSLSLD